MKVYEGVISAKRHPVQISCYPTKGLCDPANGLCDPIQGLRAHPSSLPLSDDDTKAKMATPDEALFPHPCVDWYRARDLLKPDDPRIRALFSPLFNAPPWEPRQSNPPCVARAPRAVSMDCVVGCFAWSKADGVDV